MDGHCLCVDVVQKKHFAGYNDVLPFVSNKSSGGGRAVFPLVPTEMKDA